MGRGFTLAALVAFALDQVSKYVLVHVMGLSAFRPIDVFPPWLNFRYGENCGINFGIFGDCTDVKRWILIGLALLICLGVSLWLRRTRQPRLAMIAGGLLVGGALANVVDRVLYGYVLDYLNNSLPGWDNPFTYNIADVFIFAGAFGLIFFADDKKPRQSAKGKKRQ